MFNSDNKYENVKLKKEIVAMVRKHKEKTGITIGRFIEISVLEKLLPMDKKGVKVSKP